jgi:hypothetical protein
MSIIALHLVSVPTLVWFKGFSWHEHLPAFDSLNAIPLVGVPLVEWRSRARLSVTLAPKRVEFMRELSPRATVIGLLVNPTTPRSEFVFRQMEESAGALGLRLRVLKASTEGELDSVFASLVQLGVGALLVAQEPSSGLGLKTVQRGINGSSVAQYRLWRVRPVV